MLVHDKGSRRLYNSEHRDNILQNSQSNTLRISREHRYQHQAPAQQQERAPRTRNGRSMANRSTMLPTRTRRQAQPQQQKSQQHFDAFSDMELDDFREAFALFDTEGVGRIRCADMLAVLHSLKGPNGATTPRQYPHLDKIVSLLSRRPKDATIDFDEYVRLMATTTMQHSMKDTILPTPEDNFAPVFQLFDVHNKGYITIDDLERVAVELGETDMAREELQEMMDRAQGTNAGRVSLSDFTEIMTMNLFQKHDSADGALDRR